MNCSIKPDANFVEEDWDEEECKYDSDRSVFEEEKKGRTILSARDQVRAHLYQMRRSSKASPRPDDKSFNLDMLSSSFDTLALAKDLKGCSTPRSKTVNDHTIDDGGLGVERIETAEEAEELERRRMIEAEQQRSEAAAAAAAAASIKGEEEEVNPNTTGWVSSEKKPYFERDVEVACSNVPVLSIHYIVEQDEEECLDTGRLDTSRTMWSNDDQDAYEEWQVYYTQDGERYFYCLTTGESRWNLPSGTASWEFRLKEGWIEQWRRRRDEITEQDDPEPDTSEEQDASEEPDASEHEEWYGADPRQEVDTRQENSAPRWSKNDITKYEAQGYLSSQTPKSPVPRLNLGAEQYYYDHHHHQQQQLLLQSHRYAYPTTRSSVMMYKTPRELELEEQLRHTTARARWLEEEAYYSRAAERAASARAAYTAKTQADMVQRALEERGFEY